MDTQLLTTHSHTRPGRQAQPLDTITGVVIHYVQWPGATAQRIRDYFNALPQTEPTRYGSAHYVIGMDGTTIQMIPENECAWHAGPSSQTKQNVELLLGGKPNWRTIGIELCHPDESGRFTLETWSAALELVIDICRRHSLDPERRLLRHFDCTGKDCPRWFVAHERYWQAFVTTVEAMA